MSCRSDQPGDMSYAVNVELTDAYKLRCASAWLLITEPVQPLLILVAATASPKVQFFG
jgi:hypothetical protein